MNAQEFFDKLNERINAKIEHNLKYEYSTRGRAYPKTEIQYMVDEYFDKLLERLADIDEIVNDAILSHEQCYHDRG